MSVTEIENEIKKLDATELKQLIDWLEEHYWTIRDNEIDEDLLAGRLDKTIAEVDKEYEAGLARPL